MKKGQITLFIIIGLIILLISILSYVLFATDLVFKPPEDMTAGELETELQPFENTVQDCQELILDEAANRLLRNGGYIEQRSLTAVAMPNQPADNAAELADEQLVPYWHYVQSEELRSEQPPLRGPQTLSIQSQLEEWMNDRLLNCVPFDNFPNYNFEYDEPRSTVEFQGTQTNVNTQWDVAVETQIGTKRYEGFQATIDAPVEHLYDVADEQISVLVESSVPENNLLRLLSIYATGETALPPVYGGFGFITNYRIWSLTEAQEELNELIDRKNQYLQVYGSQNVRLFSTPDNITNELQLDGLQISEYDVTNTMIRYFSPPNNTFFQVDGNPAVAVPEFQDPIPLVGMLLPPIANTDFNTDISYPLILSATHNGYTLLAGYEVNIRNTQASRAEPAMQLSSDADLCENPGGSTVNISVETHNEAEITEDVQLIYTCQEITCPLESTRDTLYNVQLPTCLNAEISGYTTEYFSDSIHIESQPDENQELTLTLYDPQPVNLEVQGHRLQQLPNDEWIAGDIGITAKSNAIFIREQSPYVVQGGNGDQIDLVPGTYHVIAIDVEEYEPGFEFVIEQEEYTPEGSDETVMLERQVFNSTPLEYLNIEQVEIPEIPHTIRIGVSAIESVTRDGFDYPVRIDSVFDLDVLGALFNTTIEEPVQLEYD